MDERLRLTEHGFLEIRDRPTLEELQRHYAESYFQNPGNSSYQVAYSSEEIQYTESRAALKRFAAEGHLGGSMSGRLLDVGCGEGWLLSVFQRGGWDVAGIDFSSFGIASHNPSLLEFVRIGDVYEFLDVLASDRESFDVVNLDHVLEHVLDPVGLLERLHFVVRPGGVLLVDVPNDGNSFHEELFASSSIERRWWIAPPEHLNYFTAESFRKTASETGWEVVDLFADFPIDWFLANKHSNYVDDDSLGPAAHSARLLLSRHIGANGLNRELDFYRALAAVGLGRSLTGILKAADPRDNDGAAARNQ